MISFDAFIVLQCMAVEDDWRVAAAARGVLDIDEKIDELMRVGAVDKSVDNPVDNFSGTEFAITKLIEDKLITKLNTDNCSKLIQPHKTYLSSSTDNTDLSVQLSNLINRNTKMSNPAYRAVVDGDMPSRVDRAAQVYAENMSATDRPAFWKFYGNLTANEQAEFNRRAARLAYRGS
jgi:hypothetical protein